MTKEKLIELNNINKDLEFIQAYIQQFAENVTIPTPFVNNKPLECSSHLLHELIRFRKRCNNLEKKSLLKLEKDIQSKFNKA